MNLADTIEKMQSADYKERFIAEYQQTKIRYEKLKDFCNKIEVAEETPKHDCPLELLREQQKYMGLYLSVLEKRALIEHIELKGKDFDKEEKFEVITDYLTFVGDKVDEYYSGNPNDGWGMSDLIELLAQFLEQ